MILIYFRNCGGGFVVTDAVLIIQLTLIILFLNHSEFQSMWFLESYFITLLMIIILLKWQMTLI